MRVTVETGIKGKEEPEGEYVIENASWIDIEKNGTIKVYMDNFENDVYTFSTLNGALWHKVEVNEN